MDIKVIVTSFCRRICKREDGSVTVEAVIMIPALLLVLLTLFTIFDAFRSYSLSLKATYTISDAISRETVPIDAAYLKGVNEMYDYLIHSSSASAIRVTSVRYDLTNNKYTQDWSQTRGWVSALTDEDLLEWNDRLPVLPDKERVVLVETWSKYAPPFITGLEKSVINNIIFTRPRYASRVCWESCPTGG